MGSELSGVVKTGRAQSRLAEAMHGQSLLKEPSLSGVGDGPVGVPLSRLAFVGARANALLDRMEAAEQKKLLKLDTLIADLKSGDAVRGKQVFFSEKSKCATCHIVGDKGKRVGPDLTTIGANRSSRDLLESIVFPSATLVRQYEPYTLLTESGRTYSGLLIRETSREVTIQQTLGNPVTVSRDAIDELVPSTVSIMPKGLDEQMTSQQIADLVKWLQTLT